METNELDQRIAALEGANMKKLDQPIEKLETQADKGKHHFSIRVDFIDPKDHSVSSSLFMESGKENRWENH
jgi:hypothetical protein